MTQSALMAVFAPAPVAAPIALPPQPRTAEETGLPFSFICDLLLKVLYFNGNMLGRDLAAHTCLPLSFLETTLKFLADEGYISTTGVRMTSLAHGETISAGMEHQISTTGRQKARELMELNQYAGPAPVPISEYTAMAEQQAAIDGVVTRAGLHDAFSDLVLSESVLDHLGPALSAREAIFLHGPPGNGKTKTGRLWTYVRDDRPAGDNSPPAVWFGYSADRKGEHPRQHLKNFQGALQADAYAGFHHLYDGGVIYEVACWAHARRKFHDQAGVGHEQGMAS